jgi:penicillin-binding protein 1C
VNSGVWVGNFSGEPMRDISGGTGAAPVMHELMVHLRQRFGVSWYERPAGVGEHLVHPITGRLVAAGKPGAVREQFLAANLPSAESPDDYDAQGRVRLSGEYREWCAAADPGQFVVGNSAPGGAALRVVAPLPGTVLYLDPDLPDRGNRLSLKTDGGAGLEWRSDTLRCDTNNGQAFAILQEGRHQITVRDPATGAEAATWILVRSL